MVRRGCVMMCAKVLIKYIEHTRDIKKPTAVLRKFVPFLTYMFCRPNKNVWTWSVDKNVWTWSTFRNKKCGISEWSFARRQTF